MVATDGLNNKSKTYTHSFCKSHHTLTTKHFIKQVPWKFCSSST